MAICEVMGSMELPGVESSQQSFPFPTLQVNSQRYKLFGFGRGKVDSLAPGALREVGGGALCMKDDLADGKLPSDDFGER